MAGNRRGRIKEHLEGVHRNCQWQQKHLSESISLIGNDNPQLVKGLKTLAKFVGQLDEFANKLYATL